MRGEILYKARGSELRIVNMKVVYPICCGIDVHKSFLVATIVSVTKMQTLSYKIEGFQLTEDQKFRMLQIRQHMEYLNAAIQTLDEKLDQMAAPYAANIRLFCTIPGMGCGESTLTILSEIGTDMTQVGSSKRLCSWVGLTPGNNQSAGKKKSVRITRAGVYIKPMLVQVAHAGVKCTS